MRKLLLLAGFCWLCGVVRAQQKPAMYFADSSRLGRPLAKDPKVVFFKNSYWMYYSIPANDKMGWGIGIATSQDLTNWKKVGEIPPGEGYEQKGLCAPGAIVRKDTLHLFYQTYGNAKLDAICHAWSVDGIHFTRNPTNPIFRPTGNWTVGRAIDAEVVQFRDQYFLYFATRDTAYKVQMQGVAVTSLGSDFSRDTWRQAVDSSILKPQLGWEKNCIEAASCIVRGKYLYMVYAGGYNNEPQQIGVARSRDGLRWERMSNEPLLPNGPAGSWNASESGHPDIFQDQQGQLYLFYQGNNDKGRTWFLSHQRLRWKGNKLVVL
ncbi:family 43 glycosylhydrolase [Paraflavitalea pollutisoli]|uniref:family 43 glycosylhydrolase n=1 Tax=Paraflavitalea pollutisoli TaxID=3034143 RepID=UPI0023EC530F|nr:family 43 glycosylhydrolase [Paraflavitalea sp. H1-2-19X]